MKIYVVIEVFRYEYESNSLVTENEETARKEFAIPFDDDYGGDKYKRLEIWEHGERIDIVRR